MFCSFRLCDEATSALDSSTEAEILNALKFLSNNRTSIFIAHRLTTAMQCDKVSMICSESVIDFKIINVKIAQISHLKMFACINYYDVFMCTTFSSSVPCSIQNKTLYHFFLIIFVHSCNKFKLFQGMITC